MLACACGGILELLAVFAGSIPLAFMALRKLIGRKR